MSCTGLVLLELLIPAASFFRFDAWIDNMCGCFMRSEKSVGVLQDKKALWERLREMYREGESSRASQGLHSYRAPRTSSSSHYLPVFAVTFLSALNKSSRRFILVAIHTHKPPLPYFILMWIAFFFKRKPLENHCTPRAHRRTPL